VYDVIHTYVFGDDVITTILFPSNCFVCLLYQSKSRICQRRCLCIVLNSWVPLNLFHVCSRLLPFYLSPVCFSYVTIPSSLIYFRKLSDGWSHIRTLELLSEKSFDEFEHRHRNLAISISDFFWNAVRKSWEKKLLINSWISLSFKYEKWGRAHGAYIFIYLYVSWVHGLLLFNTFFFT